MNSLSERDLEILWQYRNYQEDLLYQRINVFLIAQSMLFVAYTEAKDGLISGAISYLGTVMTILGWFSIIRQRFVLQFARDYVKDKVTAYGELQKKRKKEEDKLWFHRHFSGQELLCFSLPLLMLLVWLGLIFNSLSSIKLSHTLIYIALGLVILFVVLLPAFRGKSLNIKNPKQKNQ